MRSIVLAVLLAGCATAHVRAPLSAQYPTDRRTEIWNRAIAVLNERSYVMTLANDGAGLITTDWKDGGTDFLVIVTASHRHRVAINLEPGGRAVVNVVGQVSVDNDPWGDESAEKHVARLEAMQRELYETIVGHPPPESQTASTATPTAQ